jgi:hypothetical protein
MRPAPRFSRTVAIALPAFAAGLGLAVLFPPDHTPKATAAAQTAVAQAGRTTLHAAARNFLDVLSPALREKTRFPFDADERRDWHYVPRERRGVSLREMDDGQRRAALALLAAALSRAGFRKVEAIRALETVLREVENDTAGAVRNPDRYFFTVFGEPGEKGVWGLRYEGHHVSLNWTIIDGRVASSSPQFLGANPATVRRDGPQQGARALAAEEDLGRRLVRSLTPEQRVKAVTTPDAPADILTAARRKTDPLTDEGIPYRDLNLEQRALLMDLIRVHAAVQADTVASDRLERLRKAGLDGVRFAWRGGLEPGQGHYYRIQGPAFLVEYDNTQNGANHIHAVWRDFSGDFGDDVLAEHYRRFPAGSAAGTAHGHTTPHSHDGGRTSHTH